MNSYIYEFIVFWCEFIFMLIWIHMVYEFIYLWIHIPHYEFIVKTMNSYLPRFQMSASCDEVMFWGSMRAAVHCILLGRANRKAHTPSQERTQVPSSEVRHSWRIDTRCISDHGWGGEAPSSDVKIEGGLRRPDRALNRKVKEPIKKPMSA